MLKFQRFTTTDGLLSDEVYNMYKDRDNYIWIFTNYGALKYNGSEFRPVLRNLPGEELFVYSFFEHHSGRKYIATSRARLYEIVNDSAVHLKGTEHISALLEKRIQEIITIYVDDSLNLYASTKHESYKFRRSGDHYEGAPVLFKESEEAVTFSVYEKEGVTLALHNYHGNDSVYCGGNRFIAVDVKTRDASYFHHLPCEISTPKHWKTINGVVYLNQHNRIVKMTPDTFSIISLGGIVHNFNMDRRGHLWVATYLDGLYELDQRDSIVNHYFRSLTVNDVLIDEEDNLFVSTTGFGLYYASSMSHQYYETPHELAGPISFLSKTSQGVMVCSSDGSIFLFREGERTPLQVLKGTGTEIRNIQEIGDSLYLCSFYVIAQARLVNDRLEKRVFAENATADALIRHNGVIYALQRKRINKLGENKSELWRTTGSRVYGLAWKDSLAYAGTDQGVEVLSKAGALVEYLLKGHKIRRVITAPTGELIFLSPGHGIYVLDGGKQLHFYGESHGLPSSVVNNVIYDTGHTLLATSKGVYVRNGTIIRFSGGAWKKIYDGYVHYAALVGAKIAVATVNGLMMVRMTENEGPKKTLLHFQGVHTGERVLMDTAQLVLGYSENNPSFRFDLVHYGASPRNLAYELLGPYKDTGSVEGTVLKFSALPAGNYSLNVWPRFIGKSSISRTITFRVRRPLWQRAWFLVGSAIVILIFLLLAFLALDRYQKKKRDRRLAAENRLAEYKLVALKAQINPHFMSNCLAAIQHLVINNRIMEASDYLARFGFLVRKILHYSDQSLITLEEELSIATLYMDLEQLRFEDRFRYEVIVEPELDQKRLKIPALILNPVIENAIWHGLLPLKGSRAGVVTIRVDRKNDSMEIVICDNGVGRANSVTGQKRESKGVSLVEERLNNINLLAGARRCSMSIDDLTENGNPSGTRVHLVLPLNLNEYAFAQDQNPAR